MHRRTRKMYRWTDTERERNVLFNDALNTYLRLYGMNECLTTPQHEKQIGYWVSENGYGYMASDIWLRTILIVRKETRCRHIGYSYRLTAWVLLYASSHRQDSTYHGLCYTSRGAQWVHPMKDRSDDPLHHERMLYLWATLDWHSDTFENPLSIKLFDSHTFNLWLE